MPISWAVALTVAAVTLGCTGGLIETEHGDAGPRTDARSGPDGSGGTSDAPEAGAGPATDGSPADGSHPVDAPSTSVVPPLGGSSGGVGGPASASCSVESAGGIEYRLIVPAGYNPQQPTRLLIVFSGTEGGAQMCQNLRVLGATTGLTDVIAGVLDGVVYNGNGAAGATVLDELRRLYNIDNDRTLLLSESAGTTAGEALGFHLRQSYFAAYWVNDLTVADAPGATAATLGFAPHGNAGPGGNFTAAQSVVEAMRQAGYRVTDPAPYDGAGASQHGSSEQFIAALQWFAGKSRQ